MSNSHPSKNLKRTIYSMADPEGTEEPTPRMWMQAARAEILAVAALFHAALMEQMQFYNVRSSSKALPVSKTLSQLSGTLGVAGGWNCLNWGVAKTGTSEQTRDSQLFVIIFSGIATWKRSLLTPGSGRTALTNFTTVV